ncbi:hypothetical protein E8K88_07485 [Lampropedia aestuarii]|uniref:Virulence factor n=1 Tax=Lampropedia aestuarii TaxID=2562762 RepID=A0A4S5BSI7_9BURK|nr:hypothetical protein [Lampropedia aestuarii]MDH5856538.1 hypothetical protein [Lampropedia aestuarii]THJ33935.1 hypothetical protein E8K88_07485 [Lampropedia aestuarii]
MPIRHTALSSLPSGKALLLCAMGLVAWCLSGTAQAGDIQWSVGVNSGGYYAPQPGVQVQIGNGRHYQPAPQVIVVPPAAPVYVAPAPVYVTPAPVYKPGRGNYHRPHPRHGHRGHDRDRHHHRH